MIKTIARFSSMILVRSLIMILSACRARAHRHGTLSITGVPVRTRNTSVPTVKLARRYDPVSRLFHGT